MGFESFREGTSIAFCDYLCWDSGPQPEYLGLNAFSLAATLVVLQAGKKVSIWVCYYLCHL